MDHLIAEFIAALRPRALCFSCLARMLDISVDHLRYALKQLHLRSYAVAFAMCQNCEARTITLCFVGCASIDAASSHRPADA